MREKLGPFVPALFCASLSLITIIGNLCLAFLNVTNNFSMEIPFYCFLPMCFYFVGQFLSDMRKEQIALRMQLEALTAAAGRNNAA